MATSPDPTFTGGIGFGCQLGAIQDSLTRWKCNKYSLTVSDFTAAVARAALPLWCGIESCSDTCQPCDPHTTDCDAVYGRHGWEDSRPYCGLSIPECDIIYGPGEWTPVPPSPFIGFTVDCLSNPDSIHGCSPCPYCDPEADDCHETGDSVGDAFLAATQGPPCHPCATNEPVSYGTMHGPKHCQGADTCAHYPSCPDCAQFGDCNPAFSCRLYGPCGSYMDVSAP